MFNIIEEKDMPFSRNTSTYKCMTGVYDFNTLMTLDKYLIDVERKEDEKHPLIADFYIHDEGWLNENGVIKIDVSGEGYFRYDTWRRTGLSGEDVLKKILESIPEVILELVENESRKASPFDPFKAEIAKLLVDESYRLGENAYKMMRFWKNLYEGNIESLMEIKNE